MVYFFTAFLRFKLLTMEQDIARHFAADWVAAWNSHDMNRIMDHYAEDLHFTSPIIQKIGFNSTGIITKKEELRQYFTKALGLFPDLHFHLIEVCTGLNSLLLFYSSINNRKSAEWMEIDSEGKVCKVMAHYSA